MSKRVVIRISPNGQIQAQTHGIKGAQCVPYIRLLEQLLDAQTVQSAYTQEFYEAEQATLPEQIRQQAREG